MQFAASETSSLITVAAGDAVTPVVCYLPDDHPTNLLLRVAVIAYRVGTGAAVPVTITVDADEGMPALPLQEIDDISLESGKPVTWSMGTRYRSTGNAQTISLSVASGGGEFRLEKASLEVLY